MCWKYEYSTPNAPNRSPRNNWTVGHIINPHRFQKYISPSSKVLGYIPPIFVDSTHISVVVDPWMQLTNQLRL